jgi:hypothetical protein
MAADHFSNAPDISGAGVMLYSDKCTLTMPGARSRRWWELPDGFHPQNSSRPMTYHPPECWSAPSGGRVKLRSACIGQEFVVPVNAEIDAWLTDLVKNA